MNSENQSPKDLEIKIFAIWAEILGTSAVTGESHFFELGGDSLAAINMSARVEKLTGIVAPFGIVYNSPFAGQYVCVLLEES